MTTKKPGKSTKRKRRAPRKAEQLNRLETHYITLNEMYRAAKAAGFTSEVAFWLITEPGASIPDWVVNDKPNQTIPRIDPTDDEDEDE